MMRSLGILIALAMALIYTSARAQEATQFGAWRTACAPTAGCVLGTRNDDGSQLLFAERPGTQRQLLFFPAMPVQTGSRIEVTLDSLPGATLGPADGWRAVESVGRRGFELSPTLTREEFMPRMLKRDTIRFDYVDADRQPQSVVFSLNGYADARGFTDAR